MKTVITPADFTRVNNDTNGNPRYVCHYLRFIKESDDKLVTGEQVFKIIDSLNSRYNLALSRARKLGGRKFHNKQYGGGIVFQSYNIQDTCDCINELMNQ